MLFSSTLFCALGGTTTTQKYPSPFPGAFNTLVASGGWQLRRQHPFSPMARRPRGLAVNFVCYASRLCCTIMRPFFRALLLRTAYATSLFAHPGGAHSFAAAAFACSARGSFPSLRGQVPRPWPLRSSPTCYRFRAGPVCGNNIGSSTRAVLPFGRRS